MGFRAAPFSCLASGAISFGMSRISLLFLCLLPLAACQKDESVPTAQENAQLDDAANLLNGAQENLETVDDGGLGSVNEDATP